MGELDQAEMRDAIRTRTAKHFIEIYHWWKYFSFTLLTRNQI